MRLAYSVLEGVVEPVNDRVNRRHRPLLAIAIAAGSCLLLSSCAPTAQTAGEHPQGFMGPEQYQREYEDTIENFPETLPDGFEFVPTPSPPQGDIAVSLGTAEAYFQWNCAWMEQYLADPNEEAMKQLRRFPHTTWATENYEDPDGIWDETLDEAELGDLSTLREFAETDCGIGAS